jgi:hypothetical protein
MGALIVEERPGRSWAHCLQGCAGVLALPCTVHYTGGRASQGVAWRLPWLRLERRHLAALFVECLLGELSAAAAGSPCSGSWPAGVWRQRVATAAPARRVGVQCCVRPRRPPHSLRAPAGVPQPHQRAALQQGPASCTLEHAWLAATLAAALRPQRLLGADGWCHPPDLFFWVLPHPPPLCSPAA